MEVQFILNERQLDSVKLFTTVLLNLQQSAPFFRASFVLTGVTKFDGHYLPVVVSGGRYVEVEQFFDLLVSFLQNAKFPEVESSDELSISHFVVLMNFCNKTLVKELLTFETLEKDRGLNPVFFLASPLWRLYNQFVKSKIRKNYSKALKALYGENFLEKFPTHKQRLAFLYIQNLKMYQSLLGKEFDFEEESSSPNVLHSIYAIILRWFKAHIRSVYDSKFPSLQ